MRASNFEHEFQIGNLVHEYIRTRPAMVNNVLLGALTKDYPKSIMAINVNHAHHNHTYSYERGLPPDVNPQFRMEAHGANGHLSHVKLYVQKDDGVRDAQVFMSSSMVDTVDYVYNTPRVNDPVDGLRAGGIVETYNRAVKELGAAVEQRLNSLFAGDEYKNFLCQHHAHFNSITADLLFDRSLGEQHDLISNLLQNTDNMFTVDSLYDDAYPMRFSVAVYVAEQKVASVFYYVQPTDCDQVALYGSATPDNVLRDNLMRCLIKAHLQSQPSKVGGAA